MNPRISPVFAASNSVFKSAPATKMDFFADAMIRPRSKRLSPQHRLLIHSSRVAASKMFAPELGRSNVSTQM